MVGTVDASTFLALAKDISWKRKSIHGLKRAQAAAINMRQERHMVFYDR